MIPLSTIVLVCLTPIYAFVFHFLLLRLIGVNRIPAQLGSAAATTFGALAGTILPVIVAGDGEIFFAVVAVQAAMGYFHLFNMSETARRIFLLRQIYHGRLTHFRENEAAERQQFVNRLERLAALGQVHWEKGVVRMPRTLAGQVARLLVWYEGLLYPERFAQKKGPAPESESRPY